MVTLISHQTNGNIKNRQMQSVSVHLFLLTVLKKFDMTSIIGDFILIEMFSVEQCLSTILR